MDESLTSRRSELRSNLNVKISDSSEVEIAVSSKQVNYLARIYLWGVIIYVIVQFRF
jgi:hypothetical protein